MLPAMRVLAGTSGFSYDEWRGVFYPHELPGDRMLRYYAERLPSVEINNTFYRMPRAELLERWKGEVPETFSFGVKAPRRITHIARLKDCADDVEYLYRVLGVFGPLLGPTLFQLPPFLKKDVELLKAFLDSLPQGGQPAFEFRHASWFDDEVYEVLRAGGAALVGGDADEGPPPPLVPTASFGYLRLRSPTYDVDAIAEWSSRIQAQPWETAFVYFKHENMGPAYAQRLLDPSFVLPEAPPPSAPPPPKAKTRAPRKKKATKKTED
jgi:uncharacterized protein YecE (DUF72 family)